jgi:hypothetical protein
LSTTWPHYRNLSVSYWSYSCAFVVWCMWSECTLERCLSIHLLKCFNFRGVGKFMMKFDIEGLAEKCNDGLVFVKFNFIEIWFHQRYLKLQGAFRIPNCETCMWKLYTWVQIKFSSCIEFREVSAVCK